MKISEAIEIIGKKTEYLESLKSINKRTNELILSCKNDPYRIHEIKTAFKILRNEKVWEIPLKTKEELAKEIFKLREEKNKLEESQSFSLNTVLGSDDVIIIIFLYMLLAIVSSFIFSFNNFFNENKEIGKFRRIIKSFILSCYNSLFSPFKLFFNIIYLVYWIISSFFKNIYRYILKFYRYILIKIKKTT